MREMSQLLMIYPDVKTRCRVAWLNRVYGARPVTHLERHLTRPFLSAGKSPNPAVTAAVLRTFTAS